jgi:hypothetical protein
MEEWREALLPAARAYKMSGEFRVAVTPIEKGEHYDDAKAQQEEHSTNEKDETPGCEKARRRGGIRVNSGGAAAPR